MAERLVVVGGNAGSMAAAATARRRRPDLEVVAFERGSDTSYAACGIPFFIGGEIASLDDLVARSPEEHRRRGIDVHLRHEVEAIDTRAGTVEVRALDSGATRTESFDHLVVGTGARPLRPPLPGIDDRSMVFGVQTLDDARALISRAEASRCQRVVVVGGGYIGLEMAEAFTHRGAQVTVVDLAPQVMGTLDADMADLVEQAMRRLGIEVRTGEVVAGFEPGRVLLEDGSLPADLAVLGLGVTPNTELAGAAGLELGVRNAVVVDDQQRTSAERVWAAGDCCQSIHRVTGEPVHVALGTVANRQAVVAGDVIGGGSATFTGVAGTAVTKVCDLEVARTGLSEREAAAAGFEVEVGRIESTTRASYYPGAAPVTVKVLAESGSGRLLGGQIVGGPGAGKRIDALAVAIWNRMTAEEAVDLDLAYAPPVSPVWDPVATALRTLR